MLTPSMGAWVTPCTVLGSGRPGGLQDGRRDVDDVGELLAELADGGDAGGPVHDGAVAGAAPVRGHLLGPLVRRAHRVGPAHRVVVVGAGRAELGRLGAQEVRRLQHAQAVEVDRLVEAALGGALGRGAVVADDVVDQRVIQQVQVVQGLHQPADLGVGVGQEPGVDLHLAGQHRLEVVGHLVPVRDLRVERGQLGVGRDHAELLLPFEDLLAQRIPAGIEAARVPV